MVNQKEPWFVIERSEALAGLLLTSRGDVHIQNEKKTDIGIEFLLEINPGEVPSTRYFMVQVKGTTSFKAEEWMEGVKEIYKGSPKSIHLPTCVFVVNVRDNHSRYAWVAEPLIEGDAAKLRFHPLGQFHELDRTAIDTIVDRVTAWYDVLAQLLLPS